MRILHITPSYKPAFIYGGPIYSISALAESQVLCGHEVTVFTTNANGKSNLDIPLNDIHEINGVRVVYFKRITGDHTHISIALWMKLSKDANKYDVIHIHSWWSILIIGAAFILNLKKVKFILSPRGMFSDYSLSHNSNPLKKETLFNWISIPLLKGNCFHATANSESLEIKKLFGDDISVFTLPNLLKFPKINLVHNYNIGQNNKLKLLYISRIDKKKGIEFLLKAINILKFKNVEVHLDIFGTGSAKYIDELIQMSSEYGISDNVSWRGSIDWLAKFKNIENSDILILPSYNENFANIILEVLYVGKPVIISKYVGLCDYVKENNFGWIIDTNSDDIVLSIENYLQNKQNWLEKQKLIHNKIIEDFNEEVLATKYIYWYSKVLNN